MAFTVQTLNNVVKGQLAGGPAERVLSGGICTDSRSITPHCVFFALSGDKFDGNDFALDASKKGAAAVVVSRVVPGIDHSCGVILVPDVLCALQQMAAWWRERLTSLTVVGVTGSSGKTSTKDLVKSVLAQQFKVTATEGNFNNHIGLPLSVLKATAEDKAAVWEMGMNHAGELAPLCRISRPKIGIISSIGSAHIEFFSSREEIAKEKCTLPRSLPADGTMIYPADCEFADMIRNSTVAKCVSVGFGEGDVRAENVKTDEGGTHFTLSIHGFCNEPVYLPLHGRHMVSNALLAAAAGRVMGMDAKSIVQGLENAQLTGGRLKCFSAAGVRIVDDTYNANPESMKAALETVSTMPCKGKRWAVLGKMGELGCMAKEAHLTVGANAYNFGFDAIVAVGGEAAGIAESAKHLDVAGSRIIRHFESSEAASAWLKDAIKPGDLALFKGSRSAGMDRLISAIFSSSSSLASK